MKNTNTVRIGTCLACNGTGKSMASIMATEETECWRCKGDGKAHSLPVFDFVDGEPSTHATFWEPGDPGVTPGFYWASADGTREVSVELPQMGEMLDDYCLSELNLAGRVMAKSTTLLQALHEVKAMLANLPANSRENTAAGIDGIEAFIDETLKGVLDS